VRITDLRLGFGLAPVTSPSRSGPATWPGTALFACATVLSLMLAYGLAEKGPVVAAAFAGVAGIGAVALAVFARPLYGLVACVALVTVFPIARIEAGAVPIYFLDLLMVLALLASLRGLPSTRTTWAVGAYLAVWIPAWVYQLVTLDVYLEPTYGLVRNVLAVALFFVVAATVRTDRHVRALVIALAAGTLVTSLLTLGQALPGTQGWVRDLIINLAPSTGPSSFEVYPERAFALFQAPTTLAGFFAVSMVLLVGCITEFRGRSRFLIVAALVMASLAVIATYSRQWVPAVLMGLIVLGLVKPGGFGRALLVSVIPVTLVWGALGSGILDQRYLDERFQRLGRNDRNIAVRLERQDSFLRLAEEGTFQSLVGYGFAGQDLAQRGAIDSTTARRLREGSNENSFLLEFYNHGVLAGLLYLAILLAGLIKGVIAARRPGAHQALLSGLTAALATAMTLHLFDNYFSESIFMKMMLWLIVGLIFALSRVRGDEPSPHLAPAD
jgi:hypothetical protein